MRARGSASGSGIGSPEQRWTPQEVWEEFYALSGEGRMVKESPCSKAC